MNIVDVVLVVCSHYISSYCDCNHPSATDVCSRAVLICMTVTQAPTSVDQTIFGQHDVLQPKLILRDTMRGSAGLTTFPQQQQAQSQNAFLCKC